MRTREPSPRSRTDLILIRTAKTDAERITVTVDGGKVVLRGRVRSWARKPSPQCGWLLRDSVGALRGPLVGRDEAHLSAIQRLAGFSGMEILASRRARALATRFAGAGAACQNEPRMAAEADPLASFHPAVASWFRTVFERPSRPQTLGWPSIQSGQSTLILAPTGTGKTLAAFLACIDRLMFSPPPDPRQRCRVLYVSPLKALAVDVERNLRLPLAGIARVAEERGDAFHRLAVGTRTGDTPQVERARFARKPGDVLITTPESLYLLLTSSAREALRGVDSVIIDEIHALVPTKRGAHLALSLERLQSLTGRPLQRIGLSATQHPLEEVARYLGGALSYAPVATPGAPGAPHAPPDPVVFQTAIATEFEDRASGVEYRPVRVIDAGTTKRLSVRIDVPVEDMSRFGEQGGPKRTSVWQAIHPRLLELVTQHTSTLIFVNSRRIAERLAAALNELAGETVAYAHHGSLAREQRGAIEDRLKQGQVKALVATSSLELGIDMGAIDLVVQIEAPPTVASGLQRIGRAGHSIGEESRGVIFPKYRGDLLACAALTRAMHDGAVEATRYPRNALDVLAQQIVAMVSLDAWPVDQLYALLRCAAPYVDLGRAIFDNVLDMLAGRYESDDFAELRPRITWDRIAGMLTPRQGAQRVAIANGGTIPDRGLYGVFLAGGERRGARIGELDEEMVHESKPGEIFVLGASSWRIEDISFDRVLVSPAPGEPGKMPFWRGEAAGRSLELGRKIGALTRELESLPEVTARVRLCTQHGLDERAAGNLLQYLADQRAATRAVPDDRTIVVERCRDELGDYRVCVLSPFGGRVHAPWAMAAVARVRERTGQDVSSMWTDDGFVIRFPEADRAPDPALLIPEPDELEGLLIRQLGSSSLFAARFRENASRALLLPRRRPGQRAPLWQQRKRSADLLAVAAHHPTFPMLLETYRECLRDVFDVPALASLLGELQSRSVRLLQLDSENPSPFAAALLFGFVANYIYDGDAPLAERRAQALSIDQSQLRELLGEAELRELLDPDAIGSLEAQLQLLDPRYRIKGADELHDALLRLGDLSLTETTARASDPAAAPAWLLSLIRARRAVQVRIGNSGDPRFIAVEDSARYRDALGVALPPGLPEALLQRATDPLRELLLRHARTHAPFTIDEVAARFGLGRAVAAAGLSALAADGRLLEGAFRPGGTSREYTHPEVLRGIRRRSLAKLRKEVEPVEPAVLARFATAWHGVDRPRRGLDAILDAVEKLQGAALPASILEREVLRARVLGYEPTDLDALIAAGEVMWCGVEPLGERDGRVALYLTDHFPRLWSPRATELDDAETRLCAFLRAQGASFFGALHQAMGGGYPGSTIDLLWGLVWKGVVTNDTYRSLRAHLEGPEARARTRGSARGFRSRQKAPRAGEGRWSLLESRVVHAPSVTERAAAWTELLLQRHGVVTREVASIEGISGGFGALYDVFKALEESGRIRRGYFVAGVGGMQFALPGVLEQLRALRGGDGPPAVVHLAATDPANPWGSVLKWPVASSGPDARPDLRRSLARTAHAMVILIDGALAAYFTRGGKQLQVFLPDDEPDRTQHAAALGRRLKLLASAPERRGLLIAEIDGEPAEQHPLAPQLREVGFLPSAQGYFLPRGAREPVLPISAELSEPDSDADPDNHDSDADLDEAADA
jgi:ATP-dependent helicase Lhr and Lhr-like helicase